MTATFLSMPFLFQHLHSFSLFFPSLVASIFPRIFSRFLSLSQYFSFFIPTLSFSVFFLCVNFCFFLFIHFCMRLYFHCFTFSSSSSSSSSSFLSPFLSFAKCVYSIIIYHQPKHVIKKKKLSFFSCWLIVRLVHLFLNLSIYLSIYLSISPK
ncbi:unnamed protein product [Acanthosepion pharaonis]|uniref:Uncharacterized protein n=1 Tax=Acanthosepion pharaonis TaxID=158019 RepID=A0A812CC66_ACAPH|nr:unnamed protein product [Sepia pharaonis]